MPRVELSWPTPKAVIAKIDGRELHIVGVEQIEGDVHYFISSRSITKWADGEPLNPDERDSILRDVVTAARARGWNFEIG
jgi:gluconate kinase